MLIEVFCLLEVAMLVFFIWAFVIGSESSEIPWIISMVLSAMLAFSSYNIQIQTPVFNTSLNIYEYQMLSYSYPFISSINILFFVVGLALFFYDIFEKYGAYFKRKKSDGFEDD